MHRGESFRFHQRLSGSGFRSRKKGYAEYSSIDIKTDGLPFRRVMTTAD